MASGDVILHNGASHVVLLLDAVVATSTNNGIWCECPDGYSIGTVIVRGGTGAAVTTVNAANDLNQPSAATVGVAVTTSGAATDTFTSFNALPRWIKAAISILGTGTVTAILHARRVT